MDRYVDISRAQAVTTRMEMEPIAPSVDFDDGSLFDEWWAARHNQEIWGTGPGGMREAVPPPYCARAVR